MNGPPGRGARVDETGLAFAGSMLQAQLYVNDRTDELNRAILAELPELARLNPEIRWVSPLRGGGFKEFWDARSLRELGFDELAERLSDWWPTGGPHWDALARLEFPAGVRGVLLVEGKSYPDEMLDNKGLSATSPRSIEKITRALEETQRWLAVDTPLEAWLRPYYQTANRLAALYWLRRELGDDRAWLVHLCFLNDPTHKSPRLRSTREQWELAFAAAAAHLGLQKSVPNYAHVFLDGVPRPPTRLEPPLLPD
jgi:hypothetical protein